MIKKVFIQEIKSILRDKTYLFFLIYPFLVIIISIFLFPYLEIHSPKIVSDILTVIFILVNPMVLGCISAFTILDDIDDQAIFSLKVSPININSYILFKLLFSYLIGVFTTVLLILFSKSFNPNFIIIILLSILVNLQAPLLALIINLFASNKVEGFVLMKGSGILLLIPLTLLFINNWTELFISIVPGFWATRIISIILNGEIYLLNLPLYFIIGFIVNLLLIIIVFSFYKQKLKKLI